MARRKKRTVKRRSSKRSKMEDTPTGLYLVAIVGIVAVFGLVVMVMNVGGSSMALSDDLTGQAWGGWRPQIYANEDPDDEDADADEDDDKDVPKGGETPTTPTTGDPPTGPIDPDPDTNVPRGGGPMT